MARGRDVGLYRLVAVLADTAILIMASLLAYWMRYVLQFGSEVPEASYMALGDYLLVLAAMIGALLLIYGIAGLYSDPLATSILDQGGVILGGTSLGVMFTLAGIYIFHGQAFSRLMFFFFSGIAFVLLICLRVAKKAILLHLRRKGRGVVRALVIGAGPLGRMVMHVIATEDSVPYQLVGFVDDNHCDDVGRFRALGRLNEIRPLIHKYSIDEVIIALPSHSNEKTMQIMHQCQRMRLSFKVVPDVYEMSLSRVSINDVRGIPLIGVKEVSIQGANLALKRGVDIMVSLAALVLLSPLWLIISILIKLDSNGPVIFAQPRLGKDATMFKCFKFRSMKLGADLAKEDLLAMNEATGPLFKMKVDPRVTRVGRIIRRLSLDEMPQLINVLKGEMSLVGPRPPIPSEFEQYEDWHKRRLEVAPGLTGLWQVSGRSELPFDEMVMLDIYYIENWSLGLDFNVLLRTIPAVLTGRGAY